MQVSLMEIMDELSLALTTWGIDLNNHITIFKRSSLSTIKALVTKLRQQCDRYTVLSVDNVQMCAPRKLTPLWMDSPNAGTPTAQTQTAGPYLPTHFFSNTFCQLCPFRLRGFISCLWSVLGDSAYKWGVPDIGE